MHHRCLSIGLKAFLVAFVNNIEKVSVTKRGKGVYKLESKYLSLNKKIGCYLSNFKINVLRTEI
jgi:hypothetical protein